MNIINEKKEQVVLATRLSRLGAFKSPKHRGQ